MSSENDLLVTSEVAEIFGVTARTVQNWSRSGRLRSIRTPGGHWRFKRAETFRLMLVEETDSAREAS